MKNIIAIIRDESTERTKSALESIGVMGVTFLYVTGKGEQMGRVRAPDSLGNLRRGAGARLLAKPGKDDADTLHDAGGLVSREIGFGFLPKRMLLIIANDIDVAPIVQKLIDINQTGRHGDGKIFVCPMISAIRVRTGEQGEEALF